MSEPVISGVSIRVPKDAPKELQELADHPHSARAAFERARLADPSRPVKVRVAFQIYHPDTGQYRALPGTCLEFLAGSCDALFYAIELIMGALKPRRSGNRPAL